MSGSKLVEKEEYLAHYAGGDRVVSSHEYKRILDEQKQSIFKALSRIPTLDKLLEGFEGGELIVVSGIPKSGKSLLAQTLTVNFLKQNIHSIWFSYELTPGQFFSRFPGMLPLFYLPQKHKPNMVSWVKERIQEAKLKYEIRTCFIDHLHYIVDIERMRRPSLEIGSVIRQLKQTAIDMNMVIFLLCHMAKLDRGQNPSAETIRDSNFITAESDVTLVIHRLRKTVNQAKLLVEMSRRTGVIRQRLKLQKINGLLQEVTEIAHDDEGADTD